MVLIIGRKGTGRKEGMMDSLSTLKVRSGQSKDSEGLSFCSV